MVAAKLDAAAVDGVEDAFGGVDVDVNGVDVDVDGVSGCGGHHTDEKAINKH